MECVLARANRQRKCEENEAQALKRRASEISKADNAPPRSNKVGRPRTIPVELKKSTVRALSVASRSSRRDAIGFGWPENISWSGKCFSLVRHTKIAKHLCQDFSRLLWRATPVTCVGIIMPQDTPQDKCSVFVVPFLCTLCDSSARSALPRDKTCTYVVLTISYM